jgi:hypothetical protein
VPPGLVRPAAAASTLALALLPGLAWPATAAAKLGAGFNPQLAQLPAGRTVHLQLWVAPERRAPIPGRPVVLVRLPGRTLRFSGTPLDRWHRSRVAVRLPADTAGQRWTVAVAAGGRTYRDVTDGGPVVGPPPAQPAPTRRTAVWPFALGGALLLATISARWWQARPWRPYRRA